MPTVYVLPGFLESTLDTSIIPLAGVYWPNPVRITTGGLLPMALASDGVTPLPPFGLEMFGGLPIPLYIAPLVSTILDQLGPEGYRVVAMGYDWRKRIESAGAALAASIQAQPADALPVTIIGHSMGGLVAQYAYGLLTQGGQSARVRRIITVGTPSRGSYQPVLLAGDGDDTIRGVVTIMAGITGYLSAAGVLAPQVVPSNEQLVRVAASWPGLYELLPDPGLPLPPYDPLRLRLYDPTAYPEWIGVQPQHLAHAGDVWWPMMRSLPFRVPPSVMLCVTAIGYGTYFRLARPELLGRPGALDAGDQGDGIVERNSSSLPGYYEELLIGDHNSLMVHPAFLARIATLIRMGSIPVPPPDPVAPIPYPPPPRMSAPPLGQVPRGGAGCPNPQSAGACQC